MEVVILNTVRHHHQSNPLNRIMTSTDLSPPSNYTSFHSVHPKYLTKKPIHDNGKDFKLLTEPTVSQQPTITISNKDFVNATGNNGNSGSHKLGSNSCERKVNQTTNSENYHLPTITVLPNVIAKYRNGNSDSQIALPVPKNNIQKTSKAVINLHITIQITIFEANIIVPLTYNMRDIETVS